MQPSLMAEPSSETVPKIKLRVSSGGTFVQVFYRSWRIADMLPSSASLSCLLRAG